MKLPSAARDLTYYPPEGPEQFAEAQLTAIGNSIRRSNPGPISPETSEISTIGEVASPDFRQYAGLRSPAAVISAARRNARQVDPLETDRLMSEHRHLAHEMVMGRITPEQEARLRYVRWSLDKIEDAQSGPELDALRSEVDLFKQLGKDLLWLKGSIDKLNEKDTKKKAR